MRLHNAADVIFGGRGPWNGELRALNASPSVASGHMEGFSDKVGFIWSVADLLRGDYKAHEYGRVILPLTVLRRLDATLAHQPVSRGREPSAHSTKTVSCPLKFEEPS